MFFGTLGPQYTWCFFRLQQHTQFKRKIKRKDLWKDLFMRNSMVFSDPQSDFFLKLGGKNAESI